jgi:hypothetical protein
LAQEAETRRRMIRLVRVGFVVAVAVALTTASCGGPGVADGFSRGLPHARILMDRVDCDPTPDTCTRYVILSPSGTSTNALLAAATQRAEKKLGWTPTLAPEVVEYDEGHEYNGPGKTGGFINTADQELHYWNRVGYASSTPPNTTLARAKALMKARPDAVIIRIDGG